jgi:predicted SAM-dependent methyltransferase
MPAPTRLQIGTSRIENLPPSIVATFADGSWVNVGEPPPAPGDRAARRPTGLRGLVGGTPKHPPYDPAHYRGLNFLAWYFRPGLRLPFRDRSFDFAFSEHFFEHLFLDEAFELLRDCRRVLRPGAVLRTSVPDADFRSYEPPEPVGFGAAEGRKGLALEWTHPAKHKTRWSIRSLPLMLAQAGFEPVPLTWCDERGTLHQRAPADLAATYAGCPDAAMTGRLDYLMRPKSLVVDAIAR